MGREDICYYLRVIVVVELLVSFAAWTLITNMHPYWLQLFAFPCLPIIDMFTIAIWLVCRETRQRVGVRREGVSPGRERICYYLKLIVIAELLVSLVAWTIVTNLHPYWIQLVANTYLPIIDLVTIIVWLVCRWLRDQSYQKEEPEQ